MRKQLDKNKGIANNVKRGAGRREEEALVLASGWETRRGEMVVVAAADVRFGVGSEENWGEGAEFPLSVCSSMPRVLK